jgi:hypothetical protein
MAMQCCYGKAGATMIVEACDVTRGIILGMIRTGQCCPPVLGLAIILDQSFVGAWRGMGIQKPVKNQSGSV